MGEKTMIIKKLLTICCMAFPLVSLAQATGGQITRKTVSKTQKTTKKEVKRNNSSNQSATNNKQKYSTTPSIPQIQPTPIENLPTYNVVVGTMSIIGNAQGLCQSLRDKGYSSKIYWDEKRNLYRIIIGSTYSEEEALTLRNISEQTYPDSWILYVVNGKEEMYNSMAQFPGGPSALFQYLSENVHYPEIAEKRGIQGRVVVAVIVESDGTIRDARVVESVNSDLDKEAIRVVKNMPRWIPGIENGKPIRVKYTIPISFKLQ